MLFLPQSFTLEVGGQYVTQPKSDVEGQYEAAVGDASNAAVLTLANGYITCGGWYLGRYAAEPLVVKPMPIYWLENQALSQTWEASGEGDATVLRAAGMCVCSLPLSVADLCGVQMHCRMSLGTYFMRGFVGMCGMCLRAGEITNMVTDAECPEVKVHFQ
jgi:hypothetical protein